MTQDTGQTDKSVVCRAVAASCICFLPLGHSEPHACKCRGSWRGSYGGDDFEVLSWPAPSWSEQAPDDAVERYTESRAQGRDSPQRRRHRGRLPSVGEAGMTATELRGHPLTVADVGLAAAAMGYACWCEVLLMARTVDAMSPQVAREVLLAVNVLKPYLEQRERGLTAAAHLAPDHPWLPEEETS